MGRRCPCAGAGMVIANLHVAVGRSWNDQPPMVCALHPRSHASGSCQAHRISSFAWKRLSEGNGEPEGLGRLQINDELQLYPLHRELPRLRACEELILQTRGLPTGGGCPCLHGLAVGQTRLYTRCLPFQGSGVQRGAPSHDMWMRDGMISRSHEMSR